MNITLFTPYEKQKEFISRFADTDDLFGVVSAPRGSGKTLLAINLLLYWLLQTHNRKGGWIAPVYSQAKSVMDQIVNNAKDTIESSNRMEGTITFINGSTIKFLSSDSPDNIRGFRFTHLILDEAAFHKENAINTAILPTLNPLGKKCLMISTPRGKNFFFNWFNKPEVVSMSFPLTECPYVSQVLIEEAKKSLPPDIFAQEFMAKFVDSGNDVFIGVDKVSTINMFDRQRRVDVYVGIDTGLSDDKSVLTLIDGTGRVRWMEGTNNQNIQDIAKQFMTIMSDFNIVGGYIETNGIGRAMYDLVKPTFSRIRPFNTTQDNKTDMVRKLIGDIESMNLELPTSELLPELHSEFVTYTYKLSTNGKLSFTHLPGHHDDYIDSLMLANYSRIQFISNRNITISTGRQMGVKPRFGGLPT
jgi:ribosomal protein L27